MMLCAEHEHAHQETVLLLLSCYDKDVHSNSQGSIIGCTALEQSHPNTFVKRILSSHE